MAGQQDDRAARGVQTVQLLDTLGRLVRTARAASHRQQAQYGLSGTPLAILKALAVADTRSGDLAVRLQTAPSVVSRAVVPLERAGLVERTNDPDDARVARLRLTEAGRRRLEATHREFTHRFAPLLDSWSSDDVVTLTQLMSRLESTLYEGVELRGSAQPVVATGS